MWRWLGTGVAVLIVLVLIAVLYKEHSAEKPEPVASRAAASQEKLHTKPRPAANVADRPSRDRGPRP